MNNVGAMALLMPVAMQLARRLDLAPGQVLMPLAFGTILGGMTTLIGTPPNLIVSGFRAQTGAGSFGMFDFTPVGLAVAAAGVAFVALLGWRLVPAREQAGVEGFESGAYITEARVPADSKAAGRTLHELEAELDETGAQVVGLVRNDLRWMAPNPRRKVQAGDILVIEAEAEALAQVLSSLGLKLEESRRPPGPEETGERGNDPKQAAAASHGKTDGGSDGKSEDEPDGKTPQKAQDKTQEQAERSEDTVLMELAVLPGSSLAGRSASDLLLRTRHGLNLLALSRQGRRSTKRLREVSLKAGDLLLMQGAPESISDFAADNGCVPLAERELRIPNKRKAVEAGLIMAFAVGGAAFGCCRRRCPSPSACWRRWRCARCRRAPSTRRSTGR
jgi:di/tricarboxylate transporter